MVSTVNTTKYTNEKDLTKNTHKHTNKWHALI